jgi:hypothetical protein
MVDIPVGQYVQVRGRFHRSVHLGRDWDDRATLNTYVATPSVRELALRIAMSIPDPLESRAWSVTGPFGSGKSAFAVFLTDMLARRAPAHPAARAVRQAAKLRIAPLLPVMLVGRRSPLTPALVAALAEALRPISADFAAHVAASHEVDAEGIWRLFEEATGVAKASGLGGLLVIVDELGKFLEHAVLHPGTDDLFVLQHLAEGAARLPGRMLLVTIQHLAFADYLQGASRVQVAEWQKVQGRFTDVAFHLPAEQSLGLLGASLEAEWPTELRLAYQQHVEQVVQSEPLNEASRRLPIGDLLPPCVPLDPITCLLLWPLFRGKMAQNERSLFAFLTSHEPHSFQEFLQTAVWAGGAPPLFRVDQLYDYVATAIGSAALMGDRARHWAEVQHALDRLPAEAPPLAASVVKAIALIGLYGMPVGLKPTRETLALALGDEVATNEALAFLDRHSFVVHRRHQGDYALWEGSDVDLEACLEQALQRVGGGALAERIARVVPPRPWLARAHYIRTGTLRYFDVKVIDGVEASIGQLLERACSQARGDGVIVFVLSGPTTNREALMAAAQAFSQQVGNDHALCLIAFPTPVAGLEEATIELEAWRWISEYEPALARDPVARQEVRARLTAAQERLGRLVGRVLGLPGHPFEPQASEWVHSGIRQPPRSARAFSRWLSELCDAVFNKAPILRNELLNRSQLSSAAAKARRNLLEAMILHEDKLRLGLVGAPPEATMYDAVLHAGGFHQCREGVWAFGVPHVDWLPAWEAVQQFLLDAVEAPQPVPALMSVLQHAPYGLRSGPIPVVLLAILLAQRDEIALYEQGTFLPELRIEAMERLLRKPEDFTVRLFRPSEATREVLRALSRVMTASGAGAEGDARDQLVAVVKPLVVFAGQLAPYARQTRRFDDPVVADVRQILLRASDPYALVFHDLPDAFGLSLAIPENAEELARRLQAVIRALEGAYPALLGEIEAAVCETFGLAGRGHEAADQLRQRAARLSSYATDRRLATLLREAVRHTSDWREGLGRVIADGVPPSQWKDADVVTFHTRLEVLTSDFTRLEELAAEHRRTHGATIVRVGILNGRFEEARTILSVPSETEPAVDALLERVGRALDEAASDPDSRRVRVAALARALARELAAQTERDAP